MADNNCIVFPDQVDEVKAKICEESAKKGENFTEEPPAMADDDRIVYPDELDAIKNKPNEDSIEDPPDSPPRDCDNYIVFPNECGPQE